MEQYRLMEQWLKKIRGCEVWVAMVMQSPGGPSPEQVHEVEAWRERTLNRIRDEAADA